jgi:hypothetical protein
MHKKDTTMRSYKLAGGAAMKKISLLIIILTLSLPLGISSAQDPAPGNKEDNACNPGGVMDGNCDTHWAWVCGYYLARWQANGGWFTPNNPFNDACLSLLPARPVLESPALATGGAAATGGTVFPSIGCVMINTDDYANFGGNFFLAVPTNSYEDPDCISALARLSARRVYAPAPFDPNALCLAGYGSTLAGQVDNNPDIYRCN